MFYIFHNSSKKYNTSIRNSCYTGYSLNGCLPSFVHGNCPTAYQSEGKVSFGLVGNSLFRNLRYTIQRKFDGNTSIELAINNPLNIKLNLNINNTNYKLDPLFSKIIKIKNDSTVTLKSNCLFLRPIIFEKKNNFINVHHG